MRKIFIAAIAIMTLAGCKTKTKVVEAPRVRTEYVSRTDTVQRWDSVYVWQSDTIRERGDTLVITRWRIKELWRERTESHTDTLVKRDTVSVVVERESKAEDGKTLPQVLMLVGLLGIGLVLFRKGNS